MGIVNEITRETMITVHNSQGVGCVHSVTECKERKIERVHLFRVSYYL